MKDNVCRCGNLKRASNVMCGRCAKGNSQSYFRKDTVCYCGAPKYSDASSCDECAADYPGRS